VVQWRVLKRLSDLFERARPLTRTPAPDGELWVIYATGNDLVVRCDPWRKLCRRYPKLKPESPVDKVLVVDFDPDSGANLMLFPQGAP
jgi:hypothetical protein